jgi:hypothetical protein
LPSRRAAAARRRAVRVAIGIGVDDGDPEQQAFIDAPAAFNAVPAFGAISGRRQRERAP